MSNVLPCSLLTRPLWLSPFQVVVIPVGTEQEEYAREVRSWGGSSHSVVPSTGQDEAMQGQGMGIVLGDTN